MHSHLFRAKENARECCGIAQNIRERRRGPEWPATHGGVLRKPPFFGKFSLFGTPDEEEAIAAPRKVVLLRRSALVWLQVAQSRLLFGGGKKGKKEMGFTTFTRQFIRERGRG